MSGGGGDKAPEKRIQMQIFDRFSKIAREKIMSALDDEDKVKKIDALYSHPEFDAERKMLTEMNNLGLMNGIMTGIACFAFLRVSPGIIARFITRRRAASGSGFTPPAGDANNPFSKPTGYQFDASPGQQTPLSSPNFVIRGMRLGLDIFTSLLIGAYASVLLIDKDQLMKQASEIPLIRGRSLLSEELCAEFSQEFQKYSLDTWDANHPALNNGGSHDSTKKSEFSSLVEGFVANCKRRSIYEKELRGEQGLRDDEPVVIPSGGVPRDITVTLDDLMEDKIEGVNEDSRDEEFYFDKYFEDGFDESSEKD
jgi:hypothetical protein